MAANTGNGENENTKERPVTAASLPTSPKRAKRSTRRTGESITPAEAGELLASALRYCQQAGLLVIGYNETNALRLSVDGLNYADGRICPVTTKVTTISGDVTTIHKATPPASNDNGKPVTTIDVTPSRQSNDNRSALQSGNADNPQGD
ncbi:hypothetical protein FBQ81_12730 [Chloroflexi bacterium CFX6]|nr:hypothetical protein [Chloroflexi bacterium CFX6]